MAEEPGDRIDRLIRGQARTEAYLAAQERTLGDLRVDLREAVKVIHERISGVAKKSEEVATANLGETKAMIDAHVARDMARFGKSEDRIEGLEKRWAGEDAVDRHAERRSKIALALGGGVIGAAASWVVQYLGDLR